MCRVGQNRIYALYTIVYLINIVQKITVCTLFTYGSGQPTYKQVCTRLGVS